MHRLMRGLATAFCLLIASQSGAVEPQLWTISSAEEILKGEVSGFSVTADGTLLPGPLVDKLASPTDTFVLSQVSDGRSVRFFGTGGSGRIYKLSGSELELLATLSEPQVYALAWHDGSLWAGSSPNGKLYRIDPESGDAEAWFDPEEAYIWDLAILRDGSIAVATGVEGRLFVVKRRNEGSVVFDSNETHLRALALAPNGRLLAGGSGEGRIYEIATEGGGARSLFDSSYTEISSLVVPTAGDAVWGAGVTSTLPTTAPRRQERSNEQGEQQQGTEESASASSSAVSVLFSFDASPALTSSGSSEIYRVASDGYVETVWKLDREIAYDIVPAEGGGVFVATGPNGRIYRVRDDGRVELLASVPEKQIVSFTRNGSRATATTSNSGAIYALDLGRNGSASVQSEVLDTQRLSNFGEYRVRGNAIPSSTRVSFRSGNSSKPDETWSAWKQSRGEEGSVEAPPARFLQWRIDVEKPAPALRIDEVSVAWINRNVAPVIENLGVAEPGAVFLSGYPSAPGVVEATSPDEYGIFTSVDAPRTPDSGKKYFRKGFRTVSWKTSDPNGDRLRHDVSFRPRGTGQWMRLRENLDQNQLNFDTTQLPDGEYELMLKVSDEPSNANGALETRRADVFFTVDNTAPVIRIRKSGDDLIVEVEDDSPLGRVEYSVDVDSWKVLVPEDGLTDSRKEMYRIPGGGASGRFTIVRAIDTYFNVTTASSEVRR
ncbi:MAG: WD40 repeat domain-containing protein [Acidobacteria bacterium]|nr:WD40 repeat domain-containing protein [Acidobacteriota bacterium]